jgi:dipeptidyl aminopeptidase/acylaminoacyl peptidase
MRRGLLFGLCAGACLLFAAGYVVVAARQSEPPDSQGSHASVPRAGTLLFRSADETGSATFGRLAATAAAAPALRRRTIGLRCDRVHYAASRGLCLDSGGGATYSARILDDRLRPRGSVRLAGIPSRARVSPDGRLGAVTSFVSGHSYAQGSFSTQTVIIDLARAKVIADLERFDIRTVSGRLDKPDLNLWGTTFTADGDRFYATAASGGRTHLVQGSVSGRSAQVLHDNVECPSLSPDGARIAFKKRVGPGRGSWRLHVLDLTSMRETALAETRPVDDQAEWLDGARVLYGVDGDVWVARADGGGQPRRFLAGADSPVVVRR